MFVQVCDVVTLISAHCFGADEVPDGFLLTVDLTESSVKVPLPVDFITVHLRVK